VTEKKRGKTSSRFTVRPRNESDVGEEATAIVVQMFFDYEGSLEDISKASGLSKKMVKLMVSGNSQTKLWTRAVVDRVVAGGDCSRKQVRPYAQELAANSTEMRKIASRELIKEVRRTYMEGHDVMRIADYLDMPYYSIRKMVMNKSYCLDEFYPPGWLSFVEEMESIANGQR
jgi:hypothetical protein